MENTNKLLQKITAYSCAAGAVVGISGNASAALVGYDVDPDSTRYNPLDTAGYYFININNTGEHCDAEYNFEFSLSKTTGNSYDSSNGTWVGMWLYTYNSVIATTSTAQELSSGYETTGGAVVSTTVTNTWFLPQVFGKGSYIGDSIGLTSTDKSTWLSYATATLAWGYTTKPSSSWAQWGGKENKYLGLRIAAWNVDSLGEDVYSQHFGWVYMSVGVDGKSYTVKAWAYNETPGEPAVTDITQVEFDKPCTNITAAEGKAIHRNVSIYSHERNVHVGMKGINQPKGTISIYNVNGQLMQSQPIKGHTNNVRLKGGQSGLFVVKVDVNGGSKTQKVYIN